MINTSEVDFFIFEGVSERPQLQTPIFLLVFSSYIVILSANSITILLVYLDTQLQKPMYFFLSNLSLLDMSHSTVTLHRIFTAYFTGDKSISFQACIAQLYFYISFLSIEVFILTCMSYDRYVAICTPLSYPIVMNSRTCAILTTICWVIGFMEIVPLAIIISGFSCFKTNMINHFFCDLFILRKLSCNDTSLLECMIYIEGVFLCATQFSITITSYAYIIQAILNIQTSFGRWKGFYTCSSHLTVVVMFYATLSCLYLRPMSVASTDADKYLAFLFTSVTPILNPLIYCLKNKDVKSAMKKTTLEVWATSVKAWASKRIPVGM